MGILNNIKQRSDSEKKIFSLITAVVLTLIIVVTWFSFSESPADTELFSEQNKLSSQSPFQVIKDEFSKAFSGFSDKVSDLTSTSSVTNTGSVLVETIDEATSTINEI